MKHPTYCACDECFDKPIVGRPVTSHRGSAFKEPSSPTPVFNTSPLNEAVRDDVIAFMGRSLSEDETKIVDIVVMQLAKYQRTKRNGERVAVNTDTNKTKREVIIIS